MVLRGRCPHANPSLTLFERCAYVHVSICICMHVNLCASMCMYLYVSVCICMYHDDISAVCVCIACIGTDKDWNGHNVPKRPAPGPATRGPHSWRPWAGAPMIRFTPPSGTPPPQTRFGAPARAARVGGRGSTLVQGVLNRPPVRSEQTANPPQAPSKMIWLVGAAPWGLEGPLSSCETPP